MEKNFITRICIVAALGGLLFGYDTAIISGAIPFIQSAFRLNATGLGWAVSCILVGCAIGAMISGKLADRYGRRTVLLFCAVLFALSGLGTGMATQLVQFVGFRIMGGLGVGAAAMVSPMYIAEIVPAIRRGRMVALYQLAIVSGILLAYGVSYLLAETGKENWRWLFELQAVPALIFLVGLCFVPETPRWLAGKNRPSKAKAVLVKTVGKFAAERELNLINNSFTADQSPSFKELFRRPYAKVMLCGILVAVFQQTCGINAVLYYAPVIFKATGLGHADALFQTVLMGGINVLATLLAIAFVDKLGRKVFLLAGSLVMGLCLLIIALCFQWHYFAHDLVLIAMLAYVAAFACTLGAVTWVYLSEIFPNRIRGMALSVATLALWLADFIVSYTFPVMTAHLGTPLTLSAYALCCGIALIYCYRLPETKGRRLEEMETLFTN
ncbi:sugar porter family MFS transporter [Mucilaginibacter sp. dw_454]|uniref:sugar porter family MFS transporter n=1 Tax=Mucilaginibacter sp. dw_454 TaxID=2720079 RepID=UPI001BD2CB47|nr:sugar porter family MFS transporter [Mucilaginibacter sp. dw_454]